MRKRINLWWDDGNGWSFWIVFIGFICVLALLAAGMELATGFGIEPGDMREWCDQQTLC